MEPNLFCYDGKDRSDPHAVKLRVNEGDREEFHLAPREDGTPWLRVKDAITGDHYYVRPAPCSLPRCYCAAEAVRDEGDGPPPLVWPTECDDGARNALLKIHQFLFPERYPQLSHEYYRPEEDGPLWEWRVETIEEVAAMVEGALASLDVKGAVLEIKKGS